MRFATQALLALTLAAGTHAGMAQVPGEDPVVLQRGTTAPFLPQGDAARSTAPNLNDAMPAYQRAKVKRYEAKALTLAPGTTQTGNDVISTSQSDAAKTTCVQSVGSTVVPRGTTLRNNEQIVVLRGDLVNICN